MSSSTQPTQPRAYLPYISNSYHDNHYQAYIQSFAHPRGDYRTWQGATSRCIFVVSCGRRAFVLLLQVQQGGRCYRTVRYLCEDGTTDSCWKVSQAFSRLLDFSLPVVTALLLGDVYGEHTSRVRQMVLMNRVHFGHWLIADHVERSQPGVSTILVYSN